MLPVGLQKDCDAQMSEEQSGSRKNGITSCVIISQLIEIHQIQQIDLFLAFLDLEKAYDAVPHDLIEAKLLAAQVPGVTDNTDAGTV